MWGKKVSTTDKNHANIKGDGVIIQLCISGPLPQTRGSDLKLMFGSYTLSITRKLAMLVYDKRIAGAQLAKKATREIMLTIRHRAKSWKDQFISDQQTERTNPWDY